jgi:hypothetical protein
MFACWVVGNDPSMRPGGLLRYRNRDPSLEASGGGRPDEILRWDQPRAAARADYVRQGPVDPGAWLRHGWERRTILIRTRSKAVRRALLASTLGFAWLLAGCTDSNKSDGQITAAPEASNAAQAVAKSYSQNMIKQHAGDSKTKRP